MAQVTKQKSSGYIQKAFVAPGKKNEVDKKIAVVNTPEVVVVVAKPLTKTEVVVEKSRFIQINHDHKKPPPALRNIVIEEQIGHYSSNTFDPALAAKYFFSDHTESEVHKKLSELGSLQVNIFII